MLNPREADEPTEGAIILRLPIRRRARIPGADQVDWARVADDVLVGGCLACDNDAFAELVRRFERPLFHAAYRILGSYEDATDAAQHALVQAYVALPASRRDLPIRPWLFRILRNHCIDRLRRREAIPFSRLTASEDADELDLPVDAPDAGPLPDELAERSDLQQMLLSAIQTLAPRYQRVVLLRCMADLSFAEVGRRLGVPEPTARTLFQRAKATLRVALTGRLDPTNL
jgi:RNA polymerase sigma-70 factor, ECF subfamily